MKQITKFLSLLTILAIGFLLGILISIDVKGISNINYTFINQSLYSSDNPIDDYSFNVRNQTEYTGNYLATYSFNNEVGLIDRDIDFIDSQIGTGEAKVINSLNGHYSVIDLTDNVEAYNSYTYNTYGEVEFWVYSDEPNSQQEISLKENNFHRIWAYIISGSFKWRNTSGFYNVKSCIANTWYHIKYVFYANSTWDWYINGFLELENKIMDSTMINGLNKFNILTYINHTYLDAIGYSWDNLTYDFNNDTIGNEPIDWNVNNGDDCSTLIKDSLDGRFKVLELYDNSDSNVFNISKDFKQTQNQNISFEIAKDSILAFTTMYITFKENDNDIIRLQIYTKTLSYYDTSWKIVKHDFIALNTFFSIKLVLNDSYNSYDFYVNNVLEKNDINYYSNSINSVDSFSFESYDTHIDYSYYLDNILISSDFRGYLIDDNIIPLLNETGYMEVNRYEFAFEGINDLYEIADDNPSGWTDWETVGDRVNIYYDYYNDVATDRTVQVNAQGTDASGLWRDNLGITGERIDITYALDFQTYNLNDGVQYTEIFSSDNTEIIDLGIRKVGGVIYLSYYDSGYVNLLSGLNLDDYYEFNLHIDYYLDRAFISVWENGVFINRYNFPLMVNEKEGLRKIKVLALPNSGNVIKYEIDYIGVYSNGISQVESNYGFLQIDFHSKSNWYLNKHNLLEIIANGTIQLYKYYDIAPLENYSIGSSHIVLLGSFCSHNNSLRRYNLYDLAEPDTFGLASLILYLSDNLTLSYLDVEGVGLTDGTNEYSLKYYHWNVIVNESYFYVDDNNRLQFNLIANDNNTEQIEARFSIFYRTTENRSVQFTSNINGVSKGYIHLSYWGYSFTDICFPYYQEITTVYLPQTYVIFSLSIIISDLDLTYYDNCSGYITDLKFLHTPQGVQGAKLIDIDVSNLIMIIIPLIILLVPSIAISIKFGKKAILPMFILMSVICVATGLIPFWLFFIMVLGSGALLIGQYKRDDE